MTDLTGMRFSKWIVLSRVSSVKWSCECECGNTAVVPTRNLTTGASRSCLPCSHVRRGKSNRKISIYKVLFNKKVAKVAHQRNIGVRMNETEYFDIAKNNCFYCGTEPIEFNPYKDYQKNASIFVNGVDRVDSDGDYEIKNCVACCKECNFAKNTLSSENFLKLVKRIYDHSIKDNT